MRHVNFDVSLGFDTAEERWRSEQILLYMLTTLTLRNFWFLLDNPDFPKLYDTSMVYMLPEQLERRPKNSQIAALNNFLASTMGMGPSEIAHHIDLARGVEIFRDIPRMMEHGGGDCDNWACARAAEIAVAAYRLGAKSNVKPYLVWHEDGDRMIYHAKVMHGDGSDEDPSIIKGMGGVDRAADRREECRKNVERYDNMWQRAKRIMASEDFDSEDARVARASELKAAIDSFGYLPKDGVFRVGPPKQQMAVVGAGQDFSRCLDCGSQIKGRFRGPFRCKDHGGHAAYAPIIREARRQRLEKARGLDVLGSIKRVKREMLGRGGGHGGGHHGGGIRQGGFGGGWPYAVSVYPEYDLDLDITYDYDVMSAAPAPQASITPGRRAA